MAVWQWVYAHLRAIVTPAWTLDGTDEVGKEILMAKKAATLKSNGTWLVTLSACSSATGTLVPGEGVPGMRRNFVRAGALNLTLTLWDVIGARRR